MFTKDFWKRTAERAIKTFVQTLLGTGIIATAAGATADQWKAAGAAVAIATVLSVITSIAGINIGDVGTPSLVKPLANGLPDEIPADVEVAQQPNVQDAADRAAITDYLATEGNPNGSDA